MHQSYLRKYLENIWDLSKNCATIQPVEKKSSDIVWKKILAFWEKTWVTF